MREQGLCACASGVVHLLSPGHYSTKRKTTAAEYETAKKNKTCPCITSTIDNIQIHLE